MIINVLDRSSGTAILVDSMFLCRHDNVMVDEEGVWCPDCKNKDLTIGEAEQYQEALQHDLILGYDEYEPEN